MTNLEDGAVLRERNEHAAGANGSLETVSASARESDEKTGDIPERIEVTLEGDEHPFEWSLAKKWLITIQASLLIFCSTIVSSAPSGGSAFFQDRYGISSTVADLLVSVFLLGYVVGPFITAPSTEAFGRRWPSIICMVTYTVFNGACAACNSIAPLLVCRFFAGMSASGPISTSASMVTDIWRPKDRNLVMSVWSIGSFAGPALGPVVGGFISASSLGIRWIFIVMTILTGAMTAFVVLALPETYVPQLLHQKAARLRRETRDQRYQSKYSDAKGSAVATFKTMLTRPWAIFLSEPLLILSTIYASFAYSVLYMLFPLYPIIFGEIRGLRPGIADLPFVAILGGVVSAIGVTYLYQKRYVRDLANNGGKHTPELRLPPSFTGGPVMFIALLWLGWTGYKPSISPVAPAMSGLFTGIASVLIFRSFSSYVIECYKEYGASAMAALVIFRSLLGAGLPLAVAPMVRAMGVQWTATLLAGFQLLLIPIPFLFHRYGASMRHRSRYSRDD